MDISSLESFELKLRRFIETNGIKAEQLIFGASVHTVEEAAEALGRSASDLIKSMVLVRQGEVLVAIVLGTDRVSIPKVRAVVGLPPPRAATPREVLQLTGYPVGGVPPFGYSARTIIDTQVMRKDVVFGGGGSPRALLGLHSAELLRATRGSVVDIRETTG